MKEKDISGIINPFLPDGTFIGKRKLLSEINKRRKIGKKHLHIQRIKGGISQNIIHDLLNMGIDVKCIWKGPKGDQEEDVKKDFYSYDLVLPKNGTFSKLSKKSKEFMKVSNK